MNSLKPILNRLYNEWEALVLVLVGVLLLWSLLAGISRIFAPLELDFSRGGGAAAEPVFTDDAFAFLSPNQAPPELERNHAFYTIPPPNWRPRQVEKNPPPVVPEQKEPEVEIKGPDKPPIVEQTEEKKPPVNRQPPPPPPAKDFLTYQGFMSSPSGEDMALLTHEHVPGRGSRRSRSTFLQPGDEVIGFKVEEVTDTALILRRDDGETVRIEKGRKVHLNTPGGND